MANTQITIKKLRNGAIACENGGGAMVAWITPEGIGPVFDSMADLGEVFGEEPQVDYPALFAQLGLNNLTIRQIANCRAPGEVDARPRRRSRRPAALNMPHWRNNGD